jgi:hypothetical protein
MKETCVVVRECSARASATLPAAVLLLSLFGGVPEVSAECAQNTPLPVQAIFLAFQCTTPDGRPGHGSSTCDTDDQGQMICEPTVPLRSDGTATPKYMILSVLYAPPGSTIGEPGEVSYVDSSAVGTSLSVVTSKSEDTKLSASVKVGAPVAGAELSASTGHKDQAGESNDMEITRSSSSTITVRGPTDRDGLDYLQDQIWFVLDPQVNLSAYERAGCIECSNDEATWSLGNNGEFLSARVEDLWNSTGMFNSGKPVDSRVLSALQRHNVTVNDILGILSADPFNNLAGDQPLTPESARFARVEGGFPYVADDGGSQATRKHMMGDQTVYKTGVDTSYTYTTSVSLDVSAQLGMFASTKLGFSDTWTWSASNASTNSSTKSNQAMVSVGQPSATWAGPRSYSVYYDTVFHSYAFAAE